MLEGIQAVIFDLDGTLIDSMWVWKQVDDICIEKYNIIKPDDFHEHMEGKSYTEVAVYFKEAFHLPLTVEEIKQEWLDMTIELYGNEVQLKPGVKEFLEHLHKEGIRMGVATSSTHPLVEAVLCGRGVRQYFQTIVTSCDVNIGKPAPDVYLKVAEILEVNPKSCLVFEDVPKGVQAGKNARMTVCAVEDEDNVSQREELRALADYYIRDFNDINKDKYEVL